MKLRAPNVFVLIGSILLATAVMTWILPAGAYERIQQDIPDVGPRDIVVEGTYARLDEPQDGIAWHAPVTGAGTRQGLVQAFRAPLRGFEAAADVIGFILLVGGAFGVLHATGAILVLLRDLARRCGHRGRIVVIPLLMTVFSAGGAIFGMAEETIPFVLVTVPLALALRCDTVTGIAIPFIGSQAGFATAWLNPFTLGIAKGIAGLDIGDGMGYRVLCWIAVTGICIAAVMVHAGRVAADPSRSPTPELDARWRAEIEDEGGDHEIRGTHVATAVAFGLSMLALALGAIFLKWYIHELAALFLAASVLMAITGRLPAGRAAEAFVAGAKDLAPAALLVAFARGVLIVAEDGRIIDTVLHGVARTFDGAGPTLATSAMFLFQSALNLFVPSGSGQAALTMPVMAPLADVLGVSRESAVLAYQFGDGFTNMIIPTNAVLMGVLTMGKLPYEVWFRWVWKLQVVLLAVGLLLLAFAPFTV